MVRRTWSQVKGTLAKAAGAAGMQVTDARVLDLTNLAIEELANEGDWPGVVDRWLLRTTSGSVTLPYELDRLMQVTTDDIPQMIASPWFEFVNYGPGQQYDTNSDGVQRLWISTVLDRGDSPVMTPIPGTDGPWVLRVYAAIDESSDDYAGEGFPTVNVQGKNTDGEIINSLSNGTAGPCSIGEDLVLVAPPGYRETTQEFSEVTAFIKPETCGYLSLRAWNGVTEVVLANYAPQQTTCSFRKYFVPTVVPARGDEDPDDRIVMGRCRRRFVPATQDNDVLMIGNLPALREMVIALWKRDSDAWEDYAAHKANAVDIMRKEATAYLGKSRLPAISFQKGFALGAGMPFVH